MNNPQNGRDRPLLGAWEFLTSLAAIVAMTTAAIVISKQLDDGRDALALSSIVIMGIVVALLTGALLKISGGRRH